jgi:hypothetical protein
MRAVLPNLKVTGPMSRKRTFDEGDVQEKQEEGTAPAESGSKGKKKALPPGYVCKACGMKDDHAIYNCTLAVKRSKEEKEALKPEVPPPAKLDAVSVTPKSQPAAKGENSAKEVKQSTAPSSSDTTAADTSLTAFITGLPFKTSRSKVIDIFQSEGFAKDVTGKEVKLVMFEDRPEKCRGLAYVTFKSKEDYDQALALSGKEYEGRTLQIVPCAPQGKSGETNRKAHNPRADQGRGKLPEGVVKINRCYRCGAMHDPSTCTNQRICYKCKSTEHLSSQCPMKKPKAATSE